MLIEQCFVVYDHEYAHPEDHEKYEPICGKIPKPKLTRNISKVTCDDCLRILEHAQKINEEVRHGLEIREQKLEQK
jgi:hypothetical protein